MKVGLTTVVVLAATTTLGVLASPVLATGPCGNDFDGNSACPVNSPYAASGSIAAQNESDYYVFHAAKNTQLNVKITDTESPTCSFGDYDCGEVQTDLFDGNGNQLTNLAPSQPNNGVTVPGYFSYIIKSAGTYYVVVSGDPGGPDSNTAVPYSLQVTATPSVVWPPPPPPPPPACVIPSARGKMVATVEHLLTVNHCRVGKTYWKRHSGCVAGESWPSAARAVASDSASCGDRVRP